MFTKYEPKERKYRFLFAGQSGTQKSRTAMNNCKNTAILNLDDGLISVTADKDEMNTLDLLGPEKAVKFKEAVDWLIGNNTYNLIVVDTFSIYCKALEDALRDAGVDKSEFWQVWSSKITKTFNDLNSVDAHICYITHEKWTEDDGTILLTPDITGQKFNSHVRSKMDMIAYFGHAPEGEDKLLGMWDSVPKAATKNRMFEQLKDYRGFGTGEGMISDLTELLEILSEKQK